MEQWSFDGRSRNSLADSHEMVEGGLMVGRAQWKINQFPSPKR